jgi:hypothetical protein
MGSSQQVVSVTRIPRVARAPGEEPRTLLTPRPPPRRKRRRVAIVVIVVAVVLVSGLILTGAIPPKGGRSSSSGPAPVSYSSAEASAASISASRSGGPWSLVVVFGFDFTSSYSNSTPPSGCTMEGGTGTVSVAAYTGNYSNGQLSNWLFLYLNSVRTTALYVEVGGSTASVIGTVQISSSCDAGLNPDEALPSSVEDSTQVASTLLESDQVEAFLHNNSSANALYGLFNNAPGGSVWAVTYSSCLISGFGGSGAGTGASLHAELNASTDAILGVTSLPSGTSCSES